MGYLKAYRLRLVLVLLAAVISTAFMVLAPFLVGKVTTTLFAGIADDPKRDRRKNASFKIELL